MMSEEVSYALWMSDEEIFKSYREAKDPEKQIIILAELNGVPSREIKKVLTRVGALGKEALPVKGHIIEMHLQGLNNAEIARRLCLSRPTVIKYLKEAGYTKAAEERWSKIIELKAQGLTTSEIANSMGLTTQTVRNHLQKSTKPGFAQREFDEEAEKERRINEMLKLGEQLNAQGKGG